MLVSDFDFELPPELIAQQPPVQRGQSRMLTLSRESGAWQDSWFDQLPELLREGDVLVLNDSRVIPARLFGVRLGKSAGKVEVLLTEQVSDWEWRALTRPARRMAVGQQLAFAPRMEKSFCRPRSQLAVSSANVFFASRRSTISSPGWSSGACPAAPLHSPSRPGAGSRALPDRLCASTRLRCRTHGRTAFAPEILERIRARGVLITHLTLHVGLGTFQPVRVAEVAEIHLHVERYSLPEETALQINQALREDRRIVAAGTTTVRALEHLGRIGRLEAHTGATNIFLSPAAA